MEWETVIGLEIHVQLSTASKIFSGASTAFGAAPNTHASLVDLAMPGTLPVVNKEAIRKAVKFGLAIDAQINTRSVFERKNYFYPDLPKGYQTTQLEKPIVGAGKVEIQLADGRTKTIRIHHAHLEEDAGKSLHEDFHGMSGIDLNRAGTPLIEIVTEPDMRSAEEAVAFARKLHALVTSIDICDGKMAQGSMRFDVNVSVRPKGEEKLGTRTETKNLNSFKFMEAAINKEIARQIDLIEDGGEVIQETRLFNGDTQVSRAMRSKEDANDYRYFPCPDLLPVEITQADIDSLRADMPELPDARKTRFMTQFALSDYDAEQLAVSKLIADYFEQALAATGHQDSTHAKLVANWILSDLLGALNKNELEIDQSRISAAHLGQIIQRIQDGTLSSKIAKQVFDACWEADSTQSPDDIIEAQGLKQMSDSGELETIIDQVLADNPEQVDAFRAADEKKQKKMFGFFVGQVMKATQGKANPAQANDLIKRKLETP